MGAQRRNTRQRQLVLDAVRSRNDHPTADDIYLAVRELDERISRGTVYRNLNLLEETGAICSVKAPGGSRFDWKTDGHAHVVCTECGCIADAALPYDRAALEETGAICSVKAPGGSRFDWKTDGHAHVVCTECGCIADAALPYDRAADQLVASETGFAEVRHSALFQGICADCLAKRELGAQS